MSTGGEKEIHIVIDHHREGKKESERERERERERDIERVSGRVSAFVLPWPDCPE